MKCQTTVVLNGTIKEEFGQLNAQITGPVGSSFNFKITLDINLKK